MAYPKTIDYVPPARAAFFWSRVARGKGCWTWTGTSFAGYGKMKLAGARVGAHRVSYLLNRGPIPSGMHVLHKCDNGLCVNPKHLFIGDSDTNNKDRAAKGRSADAKGEANNNAKLTEKAVWDMHVLRSLGWGHRRISEKHSCSPLTVAQILRGERWRHVKERYDGA